MPAAELQDAIEQNLEKLADYRSWKYTAKAVRET